MSCSVHGKYACHCEGSFFYLKTGSKGEADKNCKSKTPDQSISAEKQSTGCANRKRLANRKLFAYYVSATDQPEDPSAVRIKF